jgi:predicted nucleic-acid-binding protein
VSKSISGSLDANAILRLTLNDIPKQSAAVKATVGSSLGSYVVVDLAIVEVEYALRTHYGFSREQINDTLGNVLQHPSINTNLAPMKKVFELYVSHPQLSFTDCCLVSHAEIDSAKPLWTFDQKLAKQSAGNARLIAA